MLYCFHFGFLWLRPWLLPLNVREQTTMLSKPLGQPHLGQPQVLGRQQLFLALQERIERGHYPAGSWLPAERALAAEFGLDRSAVRFALVQLEDRGLIVREAGHRPWVRTGQDFSRRNRDAPARTGMQTIAAILPQHPVFPAALALLHGINTALRAAESPLRLQVLDTHGGSERLEIQRERQALGAVVREQIAGVVLWHLGGAETLPQLRELERRGIPVVFVDRFPQEMACDFVGSDNHAGIEAAVEYLRQLGHRRIAHLTTDEASTAVAERLAAYTEAMQGEAMQSSAGQLGPLQNWIHKVPHDRTCEVAPACDRFFALPEPPTAVVALNDLLAYHFMAECEKRGKRTPEDISVIGFDDLEEHSARPPTLTTLHQPFDKMGRRAAEMLLRRLSGPDTGREPRRHMLLPAPLVVRSTCRPL